MEQIILLPANTDTDTMFRVKRQAHPSPHQFNLRLQSDTAELPYQAINKGIRISQQFRAYRSGSESFQSTASTANAYQWWLNMCPVAENELLRAFALRLLAIVPTSFDAEWLFSSLSAIHTKQRNRVPSNRLRQYCTVPGVYRTYHYQVQERACTTPIQCPGGLNVELQYFLIPPSRMNTVLQEIRVDVRLKNYGISDAKDEELVRESTGYRMVRVVGMVLYIYIMLPLSPTRKKTHQGVCVQQMDTK